MNRIRLVFSIACAAATVALAPSSKAAGLDNYLADHVAVHGDVLDAYNRHGRMLWHYRSVGPLQVNTRPDGNYEINGRELVGRDGRLIERLSDHAPAGVQFRQSRMPFVTMDDQFAVADHSSAVTLGSDGYLYGVDSETASQPFPNYSIFRASTDGSIETMAASMGSLMPVASIARAPYSHFILPGEKARN